MASITLVWKPISAGDTSNGNQTPSGFYHMFFLYNDGTNTYYARGGPESGDGIISGGSGSSGVGSDSGPGFGSIMTHNGLYEVGTRDFPTGPDPIGQLNSWPKQNVISGDNATVSQTWNLIINSMNRINDAHIPYDPVSANSNSAAGTALRDAGFDVPDSGTLSGHTAPGWNNHLQSVETPGPQGSIIIDSTYDGGSTHTTLAADQTADAIHKDVSGAVIGIGHWFADGQYHGTILDPWNTQLWDQRSIDLDGSGNVVADTRDYTSVANQWPVTHTLPSANLSKADENFATYWTAQVERLDYLGNIANSGAPSPLSYESYFPSGYDFSASALEINPGAVTTVNVLNTGLGFDASFSGGSNGPNSFKVGLSIPFDFFGFNFDLFGPVILNLSGGGVSITPRQDSNVFYDVDGDGYMERIAWAGPGDGMLVIDLHGNGQPGPDGVIGQALELAFSKWTADPNDTDVQALAAVFDTNHNGLLDGGDARWGEFRVWQDSNQNGFTDAGELQTLAALGISSITLTTDHQAVQLTDGSRIEGLGTFTRNGAANTFADAALAYDTLGFKRTPALLGFNYFQEDGTVKAFFDAKVAPWQGGGVAYTHALNVDTAGADGLFGGQYDDILKSKDIKPVTIYGDLGNDIIWGGNYNDVLDGGPHQDLLLGFGGDDTIYFDFADLVNPGQDINGGPGYDTGIFTTNFPLAMSLATYGLESLISNEGNDLINANPAAAAYIDGRGGNDTINGGPLGDTLVGGTGNDAIHGGDGADLLSGGADSDLLAGDGGNDVLMGGPGNDTLVGGAGNDTLIGGDGSDTAYFSGVRAAYTLTDLGNGFIQVSGPDGTDVLSGVELLHFDDQVLGLPLTRDLTVTLSLAGLLASYTVRNGGNIGANATAAGIYLSADATITTSDMLLTGSQIAALNYGAQDSRSATLALPGNLTPGTYYLGAIADTGGQVSESDELNNVSAIIAVMLGNAAANILTGSAAADTIFALDGNDVLNGGGGADWLIGGTGADRFVFDATSLANAQSGVGFDRIADYDRSANVFNPAEGDQIDLSAILGAAYGAGQTAGSLVHAVAVGTGASIQVDVDGAANGVNWTTIARLENIHAGDSVNVVLAASQPAGVAVPVERISTTDFDRDHSSDILWRTDGGWLAAWEMDGTHIKSWDYLRSGDVTLVVPANWHVAGTADFDADGKNDILWRLDDGSLAMWEMDGTHLKNWDYLRVGPTKLDVPTGGWQIAGLGDYEGDGKSDVLWQTDGGALAIWQMDGTHLKNWDYVRIGQTQIGVPAGGWHVAANSDFDGDGKSDVLWQTDSGALAIWQMDGTQIKSWDYLRIGDTQQGVPTGWHVEAAADFDGDGKNDILWRTDGGVLAVWEMDGTHLKAWDYLRSGDVQLVVPANWHVARLGDYDGDGKNDILWQNDDGSLPIWEMDGTHLKAWDYLRCGDTALGTPGGWHMA
jgi:Ca2+-binding RTX toxin-like protein